MTRSLMLVLVGAAVALSATGSGGTAAEQAAVSRPPAYGIFSSHRSEDPHTLVRVDPRTLRPVAGRSLRLASDLTLGGRSPDGRFAAFMDYRRPLLRVIDLGAMRVSGDVRLASGSRWRTRGAAWLTADRVAVVVQRMRGAYNQIVDRRELVLVDPIARRVVARRPVAGATAVRASASGGDKLVLLLGRADLRRGPMQIVVVDGAGTLREAAVDGADGSLVVEPSGRRAFLVSAGPSVVEIDLETMQLSSRRVSGGGAVFAPSGSFSRRHGVWVDRETLAVTGHNRGVVDGVETSRPAGLALVDASTWRARLIDPAASTVSFSARTLVASSIREAREVRRGRRAPTLVGIGLRAYEVDGTLRWRRFAGRPLSANAFRNVALVYPHQLAQPSAPFVIDLPSGRRIGAVGRPGQNFWLLPDAPAAASTRRPSSEQSNAAALEVDGDGAAFTATARDDVTRVVAALVDGTQREIAIDGGHLGYEAATPDERARLLQAYAGDSLVASVELPVSCGGSAGPCAAATAGASEPTYAFLGELPSGGTSLVRIDARTLRPLGEGLKLDERFHYSFARSPDGKQVALAVGQRPLLRIVDLERLEVVRTLRVQAGTEARALAWLADDRLVAVVQRMSQPTRRYVRERAVVTLEPSSGRVIARRRVTSKLAVGGVATGAGRLVFLMRPSGPDGSEVQLVVAEADGALRTRAIDVGRQGGVLNPTALAVDPTGRRAFLVGWAIGRRTPPVTEVDLETMTLAVRPLRVERTGPLPPAGLSSLSAGAVDQQHIAAIGAIASTERRDQRILPAAGVFLIDTESWTARLADPRAIYFQAREGRLVTHGPSTRIEELRRRAGRGSGISAYDTTGRRLYHLYANRPFSQVVLAGEYGHVLLGPPRTKRLVFDARRGRPLGMLPALERPIEILQPPPPRPSGTRTTSSVQGGLQGDTFTRVSNRGTRVRPKAEKRGEREFTPRDLFLLRRDEGRAVYRIGGLRRGYNACYAGGFAIDLGRVGTIACGRSGFPSQRQPLFEMSAMQMRRGDKHPHLFRLEGVAADAIAEIGLTDADGDVIARVPVEDNVYLLASPPAEATGGLVAYDRQGVIVFRTDRRGRPPAPPPPPTTPGGLAGFRIKLTLPKGWHGEIRRSSAGPARALVVAGNRLPVRNARSISLSLDERDPRSRSVFPPVARPPTVSRRDVRPAGERFGRVDRRFTLNGRQFRLSITFGTVRPAAAVLADVNRLLATLEVGAIAVSRPFTPTGVHVQRGRSDGVSVDVYRSGTVVFRFDTASRLYRHLRGRRAGVACLTFDSVSPWEPNEWWATKPLAPTVNFAINEATRPPQPYATLDPETTPSPPFDGCLVSGSYGRKWNDPRGQRSPAEIAFTARGRRFFDERAVARDLAMFIRSPVLSRVRRAMKQDRPAPAAAAITRTLPPRVVAVDERSATPARGGIGVWTNEAELLEVSQRAASGKRLFIEVRGGRIARHNLEGLAFVF